MEFRGVYHHWDSYPSGLGRALFRIKNERFRIGVEPMLKMLIDEHPAGWSTVVDKRFDPSPGAGCMETPKDDEPRCYCHGTRHEQGWAVTHDNASASGVEYAYVFDGSKMLVVGSYCRDGAKMIGMFGSGDENAQWAVIAEVDLDGKEPDWDALDQASPIVTQEPCVTSPSKERCLAQPVSPKCRQAVQKMQLAR